MNKTTPRHNITELLKPVMKRKSEKEPKNKNWNEQQGYSTFFIRDYSSEKRVKKDFQRVERNKTVNLTR